MIEIWRELAKRFGDVKFCQIRADLCIEGYPEKNTPTVLVYKDGDIKKQLVTLRELRGPQTKAEGTSVDYSEIPSVCVDWLYAALARLSVCYRGLHKVHLRHLRLLMRSSILFGSAR